MSFWGTGQHTRKRQSDARRAIADDYQPALRRYKAFIQADYRPKAPDIAGLASFEGGARYYEFLIRARIVRGRTAAQIHELGLSEVAEKALGACSNVKDFHAVVIDNGMMPLAVLEKLVDEWIAGGGGRTKAR